MNTAANTIRITDIFPVTAVLLLLLLSGNSATAQADTIRSERNIPPDTGYTTVSPGVDTIARIHSPARAARLSAILPGLGQAYNRKYWKIPVVYAALGTSGYYIHHNNKKYQEYREAYIARTDDDTSTVTKIRYSTENIRQRREYYRRNLELSILITAGIYLLNIVDATVDAHLFYFDVSDDLTVKLEPEVNAFTPGRINGGFRLSIFF